eukprot:14698868-Alexandrium_andersonii.AAC.1
MRSERELDAPPRFVLGRFFDFWDVACWVAGTPTCAARSPPMRGTLHRRLPLHAPGLLCGPLRSPSGRPVA